MSDISSLVHRELESSFVSILSSKSKEVFGSQVILLDFVHLIVSTPTQTCICLHVYFDIFIFFKKIKYIKIIQKKNN
nr:MAG TPA: hypothetical protein [Bacteriophage sp.]